MTGFTLQIVPVACPKCKGEKMRPYLKRKLTEDAAYQIMLLCEDCNGGRRIWVSKDVTFEYQTGKAE